MTLNRAKSMNIDESRYLFFSAVPGSCFAQTCIIINIIFLEKKNHELVALIFSFPRPLSQLGKALKSLEKLGKAWKCLEVLGKVILIVSKSSEVGYKGLLCLF